MKCILRYSPASLIDFDINVNRYFSRWFNDQLRYFISAGNHYVTHGGFNAINIIISMSANYYYFYISEILYESND